MPTSREVLSDALKSMNEGFDKFEEACKTLSRGPRTYYYERFLEYIDMLFDRYAPFKAGDRVVLCKAPNCENGWAGSKQDLVKGAKGTVKSVDIHKGRWYADVVLDEETWIDRDGNRQPVDCKHAFGLSEDTIVRI